MGEASDELEFERAARLRDRLGSGAQGHREAADGGREESRTSTSSASAEDELEAAVQVFFVRRGRVVGRKGFVLDKVEDVSPEELVDRVLEGIYADRPRWAYPSRSSCPTTRRPRALRGVVLTAQRGSKVTIRVPQRGDKRELLATVSRNAAEEFTRHRLRRASDHNSRAKALNELQEHLGLPEAPLRIECYDMSHIQGSDYVGSMVVLEDGLPKKTEYRRFKIKGEQGNDDFAAMEEVLTRRLTAYLADREKPVTERGGRFSYPPQLLLVDGGKGQLGVAVRVLEELGLERRDPGGVAGQALRGGVRPGRGRARARAPPVRGALPAAAHPRRGPPLRHHLPPRAAGQADDDVASSTASPASGRRAGSDW